MLFSSWLQLFPAANKLSDKNDLTNVIGIVHCRVADNLPPFRWHRKPCHFCLKSVFLQQRLPTKQHLQQLRSQLIKGCALRYDKTAVVILNRRDSIYPAQMVSGLPGIVPIQQMLRNFSDTVAVPVKLPKGFFLC